MRNASFYLVLAFLLFPVARIASQPSMRVRPPVEATPMVRGEVKLGSTLRKGFGRNPDLVDRLLGPAQQLAVRSQSALLVRHHRQR